MAFLNLGWLFDLIAQHVYLDSAPLPQRRGWNFKESSGFTITDNAEDGVLDIAFDVMAPAVDPANYTHLDWYLNPATGSDANTGIEAGAPLATWEEFERRIVTHFADLATQPITLHVMAAVSGQISINANWKWSFGGVSIPPYLSIDGAAAQTVAIANVTIETVQLGNAVTNAEQHLHVAGGFNWAPYVNHVCEVTAGDAVGQFFTVVKDLGAGTAQISQALFPFADSGDAIAAGDVFRVLTFVKFGDSVVVTGAGGLNVIALQLGDGSSTHSVLFAQSNAYVDRCTMLDFDAQDGGPVNVSNCVMTGTPRAYSARMYLYGGHCNGAPIAHDGGHIQFNDYTIKGSGTSPGIRCGTGIGSYTVEGNWLRIDDTGGNGSAAITIDSGWKLRAHCGIMGAGNTRARVVVAPGGRFFYTVAPTMTGTGTPDSTIGGTDKAWAAWPYIETTKDALAIVGS